MVKKMTPEERIQFMKKNLKGNFEEEAKTILKDGKVLKGEEAKENFNTELNGLTFEIEELYPLNYDEFVKEFPRTIELIEQVSGNGIVDAVNDGHVIQGWSVESNVNIIINNIKQNVKDPELAEKQITLRQDVLKEITRMKKDFDIEWSQDLFWKCWKIKEGALRLQQLIEFKGETLAQKRIDTIKQIGGIEFLKVLQKEVYQEE